MTKIKGRTQTGAWIETLTKKSTIHYWTGRTQTGAWIETEMLSDGFFEHFSRTQTGAWIETEVVERLVYLIQSHPNGCVD